MENEEAIRRNNLLWESRQNGVETPFCVCGLPLQMCKRKHKGKKQAQKHYSGFSKFMSSDGYAQ